LLKWLENFEKKYHVANSTLDALPRKNKKGVLYVGLSVVGVFIHKGDNEK
jgi:hypothetical protein